MGLLLHLTSVEEVYFHCNIMTDLTILPSFSLFLFISCSKNIIPGVLSYLRYNNNIIIIIIIIKKTFINILIDLFSNSDNIRKD